MLEVKRIKVALILQSGLLKGDNGTGDSRRMVVLNNRIIGQRAHATGIIRMLEIILINLSERCRIIFQ